MTTTDTAASHRPLIAFAVGCPAGIAPELTARMLVDSTVTSAAQIVTIGDRCVIERGAAVAGVELDLRYVAPGEPIPQNSARPIFVDLCNLDPADISVGTLSEPAGRSVLANFKHAIALGARGEADAVAFSPFNKASMRLAHPAYEDEIVFVSKMLGFQGTASEFNILPELWNARVTSHVPISAVASLITFDNVLRALRLTDQAMREGGYKAPRIAVAGLNPHAGDSGNFGREEIDVIGPAIAAGQAGGILCHGPLPPDTVFVRARKGEFDAVLTMYHDQGQVAMKLIGFDRGITLLAGFPFPLLTAAHGSAYDIAGKGIADPGALRAALLLAARMGARRQAAAAVA
ncbi:4-hydroxythreonine-4-phosphate dehydrogenase PdxA [Methylobacterium nodulans]|uniref:Pyridoxal phosphate biosynthetic protein PdxA n=1 Tax=Methylobacterium nodulans (strain LMG 21967 / CNCM I-2342 / ORS 2060) TaxID=460265 RepID=B8IWD3_METNO|nr:4-hydroxythreonine-4-phosphate dehydrogenase PdxA [Methylobacterium nodulans]ACL62723.1 Pyridoxal phosphate biosynthetic protein PdxA [Methylobacterium nodulans ORS 2060]